MPPTPAPPPRLLDRVRAALRTRHCSLRTEKAYVGIERNFAASTQNQAQIAVRAGKGAKDRVTMLPAAAARDLAKHLEAARPARRRSPRRRRLGRAALGPRPQIPQRRPRVDLAVGLPRHPYVPAPRDRSAPPPPPARIRAAARGEGGGTQ